MNAPTRVPDAPEAITPAWLSEALAASLPGVEVAGARVVERHSGNQFVEGAGVGFHDWAVVSRSPGVRDLGIYLCGSCPPELRREREHERLGLDRQRLARGGVPAPDPDELFQRYRMAVLYGWVAATTTAAVGDRWQPLEVGMKAMRRSTRTCDELATVEAFREVL